MPTIFSKIVSGEIKAHIIAENESFIAFLDINPLVTGHALVIPKKEKDYFFDLSDEELTGIMKFAKNVSFAIKRACPCRKVGVAIIGLEVAHAHVHLIPMNNVSDMNFANTKLKLSERELSLTCEKIKSEM